MKVEENIPLAKYSTYHVGGKARFFGRAKNEGELLDLLNFAQKKNLEFHILGGGTNTLFKDCDFEGIVIKIELSKIEIKENFLIAEAGAITRLAIITAAKAGLRGMEHLAGVPGTIGGAVRGNAGSFGMETKDCLSEVEVLRKKEKSWEKETLQKDECYFGYRDSIFKKESNLIIIKASFFLEKGNADELQKIIEEDMNIRRAKQPYEFPSAGSVFKNPTGLSAGKLIEEAQCKGLKVGDAEVSKKHGNFIINKGKATSGEIMELINRVKKMVKEFSGVELDEEIVIV